MRTDVLQVVTLATYTIPLLKGETPEPVELYPSYPTFEHVQTVDFNRANNGAAVGCHTNQVAAWMRRLASESVEFLAISLRNAPLERQEQPTSRWGILTDGNRGLELWQPHWRRRSGAHELKPRYAVDYQASRVLRLDVPFSSSLESQNGELLAAVASLLDSRKHQGDLRSVVLLEGWERLHEATAPLATNLASAFYSRVSALFQESTASVVRLMEVFSELEWNAPSRPSDTPKDPKILAVWVAAMQVLEAAVSQQMREDSSALAA